MINAQITTISNSFDDSTVYTDTILYTELNHPTIPKGLCGNGCALGIVFPSWANSAGYSPFIGVDSSTTTYPCDVESESGTLFVDPTSGVCQMIVQTSGSTSYYIFKEISVPNNLSPQWFKISIPSILTNSHINEPTDTATTSLFQKQGSGSYTTFAGIQGSINLPVYNQQIIPLANCTFTMQDAGVNAKVQENVEAYFTFTTGIPATFTNKLILQFPPEFSIDSSTDYNDYELTGDCYYDASATSVESSGYKIIIGDYTMYTFLSGEITCTLKITNLIAPLYF
ncbi:hypothetical protein PPERSA_03227 [Pseudocohnilembus persalinus]|uniref:Uncharacterized protein n=1 Tax=Pseudocohnilembus persalinus TaxID=266149 RepID=A0A0V0QYR2_PSEPJ|nr:hypothetical protein PPERSA_03227 [Pseudocohnilembus persalinus]|eukprot:KRX07394.1 hypothetical protein PPERSA_03227 [Pseudocohnilembus persalinus]